MTNQQQTAAATAATAQHVASMQGSHGDHRRVDADVFKAVMRQLAGGVTVITTADGGEPHGFTATAFCSVCAEPPTVLIVVNRTSRTHPHIDARRRFAVNILADDQQELADRFAGKRNDQFEGVSYAVPEDGAPVFDGVSAHLQCLVTSRLDVGTHTIFIGDVVGGGTSDSGPLVYHAARYGRVEQIG
jgi:flavin reductase (DIM6/NTAB) family NADH-FMN oxidoreductase RutF